MFQEYFLYLQYMKRLGSVDVTLWLNTGRKLSISQDSCLIWLITLVKEWQPNWLIWNYDNIART